MIKDKVSGEVISGNKQSVNVNTNPIDDDEIIEVPEQVAANGPMDVLKAMKEILKKVTWQYGVPDSPQIFKTVQVDDGQYERIISTKGNMEEPIGFPCAFVHFINWHYLVQANRINEGRSTLRIRFILNRLNNHDGDNDLEVYYVAERIHQTITENIENYPCLQERCQLQYIDPMESFDHGLQPCWITYEIWFRQENINRKRRIVKRKIVMPPFTNHSDQDPNVPGVNIHDHTNSSHPRTYDEASGYELPENA